MFVNHCCNLKGHQIKWNCWGKKHKLLPYDSRHCNPCSHLAFNKLNNCTLFLFKKILFGVQMKEVRDVQKSMWKRLWWMCIFLTRTDTVELTRGIWFVYACASLISVKLQTYCHSWQQFFFFFFFLHWQFKKNKKKTKKKTWFTTARFRTKSPFLLLTLACSLQLSTPPALEKSDSFV